MLTKNELENIIPAHSPYGAFCPAPGHRLGFNDLKVIEVAELLAAHDSSGSINGGDSDIARALAVKSPRKTKK